MSDSNDIDQACKTDAFGNTYDFEECCCYVEKDEEEGSYENPCEQWEDACCC